MKTSRLVLAPAVAVALTGLASAPAFATTTSSAPDPAGPFCAYDSAQSSNDSETDSKVPDKSDPQATLAEAQVTRDDIANRKKGIGFSGTGFSPDEKATVTVVGTDGSKYSPKTKLTVDEKGKVSGTYFFSVTEEAKVPVGKYSLYLTDLKSEKKSSKVDFEVVAKASDVDEPGTGDKCETAGPGTDGSDNSDPTETDTPSGDPTESKAPSTPAETPTKTEDPSQSPSPSETKTEDPSQSPSPSETKTEEPSQSPSPTETKEARKPAPSPTETKTEEPSETPSSSDDSDDSEKKDETPAAEPSAPKSDGPSTTGPASPGTDEGKKAAPAAKQALYIDPTEISSEDFLGKGIKLGVSGAQPGEKITITVEHAQGKVDRYTMTKQADSEGKATFGVQAKVKAVLGTYNVRAQAESFDEPQGGSFTVLTNGTAVDDGGSGSGSNDNNGSGASSDLPRTGAEMTGLALGVGLLAVGAAAVIITRRRMNASDDPAEF